jgi:hypothetical protein
MTMDELFPVPAQLFVIDPVSVYAVCEAAKHALHFRSSRHAHS